MGRQGRSLPFSITAYVAELSQNTADLGEQSLDEKEYSRENDPCKEDVAEYGLRELKQKESSVDLIF